MALVFLGTAFCIGCGDSSTQSWEGGKSQSSVQKKSPKIDDTADNDDAATAGESGNPHEMINPYGAVNPHGGQMPADAADEALENNGKLDLDTAHWTVPKSWLRKTPKMPNIIQAEYGIPKVEGDKENGRLTVSVALGSLEDNVARWKHQFGDKPDKENEETLDAGGVKIVLVDFSGTFNDSRGPMMMGPTMARPDYRMLGAIFQIPGEDGLHFVKCYGPKKTITARADEVKGFVSSLKVDK
jgi:hypothetical protein